MKLYAAYTEYGDIFIDTIRRDLDECEAAVKIATASDDPFAGGVCIATWDYAISFIDGMGCNSLPVPSELTWVKGCRAAAENMREQGP